MPRCGCDCKNQTIDADSEASAWPCCDTFPDGVPCRYAAIFECGRQLDLGGGNGLQQITCPVLELRKACFFGCEYVAATTVANAETCENLPSLTDVTTDAINPSFPPTHDTGGYARHKADFRDVVPIAAGTICYPQADWVVDHWTLDISADPVTLTYTNAWALGLLGRSGAVYQSIAAWDEWGRNTMHLTDATAAEWPELPRRICVVALDDPGITNPCDTHATQCVCCDPGTDEASITGNFSACSRVAGEVTWTGTRYKSPTALPTGVSYPASNPCGVFWGTIGSGGDGCTNGGVNWSGSVGLMTYCDGETWAGKAYCYDTDLEEWVEQGDLTISNVECRCGGVYFDVTLPTLDCCCDGTLIVTDCCPDGIPDTLTVQLSGTTCADFVTTVTWNGTTRWEGTVDICGLTMSVTVTCDTLGTPGYVISVDYIAPLGGTLAVTDPIVATCSPFEASQGSLPTFYQDAIATCCGGSSGTGTLTATE